MDKNFYITTTLPYVNSDPHIGFAMELVRADVIARSKKLQGYNVFFNTSNRFVLKKIGNIYLYIVSTGIVLLPAGFLLIKFGNHVYETVGGLILISLNLISYYLLIKKNKR